MGGSATTTQTGSQNNTTNYIPDAGVMKNWGDILGTAQGMTLGPGGLVNVPPPQAGVAAPGGLTSQYWNNAGTQTNAPDMTGFQRGMTDIGSASINQYVDPNAINFNQNYNFTPGGINFNNPFAGGTPNVNPVGGVSGLASSYQVNPMQVSGPTVSAQMVSAPSGVVNPITGLMQVTPQALQQYQMGQIRDVQAPNLRDFTMQAAANVAPSGLATTQSWTDPGTAAQYMSPYTQNVVDTQLAQAAVQNSQQLANIHAQAAQAGAFGGSRQAVEDVNQNLGYQQLAANLEAQGLQSAYQQGQQQFNTQQGLAQQAQQFNISSNLQAQLANQQAQQQAAVQNLSSFLQTQGLGAQTGLQAALANQGMQYNVGNTNLQALLGVQQLGYQGNLQSQLANQSTGLQAGIANQQAQEFTAGQQLQASLANQQAALQAAMASAGYNMQGQLANQSAGVQTGLAAQQMGLTGAQFNASQGMQSQLANQAAIMQALGLQYQGGLQGALQTQNLGMQGQIAGGQMGLQSAIAQQQARNAQQGMNLQGFGQAANIYGNAGQLGLQGFNAGLQGLGALQQAGTSQQGYLQQLADTAYQNQMMGMMTPLQAVAYLAQLQGMAPLPYTQTSSGTSSGSVTQPGPGFGQFLGGILGGVGSMMTGFGGAGGMGKMFGFGAKGGPVSKMAEGGLANVIPFQPRRHGPLRRPLPTPASEPLDRAAYRPQGLGSFEYA